MKKLLLTIMILGLATNVFAMSNAPKELNVKPDVLLNGKEIGTFISSNARITTDYINQYGVYPQADGTVKVQFILGSAAGDNLSYCASPQSLPSNEVGKVGRVAFNKIENQLKVWKNKQDVTVPIERVGDELVLNPANIESINRFRGFVADANRNGCKNPYGSYPDWSINIIMKMTSSQYEAIKDDLVGLKNINQTSNLGTK